MLKANRIIFFILGLFVWILSGCVTQPTAPPPGPSFHSNLSDAVQFIATNLRSQVTSQVISEAKLIPVDLFLNEHSAEEATASKNLQSNLIAALSATDKNAEFISLNTKNIQNAKLLVIASYASIKPSDAGRDGQWLRLKVGLTNIKTGELIAQVVTHVNADQFNSAPTRFYKNSPMYLTDAAHKDRNAVLSGQKRSLGNGLILHAALTEATEAFEAENWPEAEQRFQRVLELSPQHTGALSGLYQVYWISGRKIDAEKMFVQLATAGIDAGSLSVKLLFKLGSTDFIDDTDLMQQYQLWLRGIGQAIVNKKACLNIEGHASASGSADFNQKLSLSRATRIATRIQQFSSVPKGATVPYGKGVTEMIVGTGANNATDSIDRRVEFVVRSCH